MTNKLCVELNVGSQALVRPSRGSRISGPNQLVVRSDIQAERHNATIACLELELNVHLGLLDESTWSCLSSQYIRYGIQIEQSHRWWLNWHQHRTANEAYMLRPVQFKPPSRPTYVGGGLLVDFTVSLFIFRYQVAIKCWKAFDSRPVGPKKKVIQRRIQLVDFVYQRNNLKPQVPPTAVDHSRGPPNHLLKSVDVRWNGGFASKHHSTPPKSRTAHRLECPVE